MASTASLSTEGGRALAEAPALPGLEWTTHFFCREVLLKVIPTGELNVSVDNGLAQEAKPTLPSF